MLQQFVKNLLAGKEVTRDEAREGLMEIMSGQTPEALIAAFITALRFQGASATVIAGCAEAMRQNAVPIKSNDPLTVDIVGTGGDGANTFNISTASAFVAAGAGLSVAKHGSYGVSSKCGSANVLTELGINIKMSPAKMEECLDEIGIAFLFAPTLHPAMKHVVKTRRELGFWSIFNILGPLCNPSGARYGILGVFSKDLIEPVSEACAQMGMKHLYIVHGNDGLDELTTTTTSMISEIDNGRLYSYEIEPRGLGLERARAEDLRGGLPAENASLVRSLLQGEPGPKRDIVLLNAAFAILSTGKAANIKEGLRLAEESIDSGRAIAKLKQLANLSQS